MTALTCALGLMGFAGTAMAGNVLVGMFSPHKIHEGNYHFTANTPLFLQASTYDKQNEVAYVEFYVSNGNGGYNKIGDDHSPQSATAPRYDVTFEGAPVGQISFKSKAVTHDGRVIESQPVTVDLKPVGYKAVTYVSANGSLKGFTGTTSIPVSEIAQISLVWDGFVTATAHNTNSVWFGLNPLAPASVERHSIATRVVTHDGTEHYSMPKQMTFLPENCSNDWDESKTYWANDFVYHDGAVYRSRHWSYNQTPTTTMSEWDAWDFVKYCVR